MTTEVIAVETEVLRLREQLRQLETAYAHLDGARKAERSRARFLELVAGNQSEEVLLESLSGLLEEQAPGLAFSLLRPTAGDLWQANWRGLPPALAEELGATEFSSTAPVRKAILLKRPVCLSELRNEPDGGITPLLQRYGFRSLYCCPAFQADGRLLGMLAAYSLAPVEPDEKVKHLIDDAAILFATGVEHCSMTERLYFQAHHDMLTSLPNRAYFYEALQDSLKTAAFHGTKAAVLWIGLDRFKQVNEALGHRTADLLLRMAALRLNACLDGATAARMGGDEFVVLLKDIASLEPARELATSILTAFREPFGLGENNQTLSMSIGVSLYPDDAADAEELIHNADAAMYAAKHGGRNRYVCFESDAQTSAVDPSVVEFHLRRALQQGELELYFQPLVSCKYGSIAAFETLLRWFSPTLGAVPASQFIPVAEASGLIVEIGTWVLQQACQHAASWQTHSPGVRVAVNVAAAQLAREDFPALVRAALQESALPPSLLELELTESAVIGLDDLQRHTASLRALGVSLAIDDFGTGYSSLSYLHTLQVQTLKIDRSFVQALGQKDTSARLAETIISMARTLGLKVVAEGIETLQQLQWLTDLGCDLLQGYYLHRPMPAHRVIALLSASNSAIPSPQLPAPVTQLLQA